MIYLKSKFWPNPLENTKKHGKGEENEEHEEEDDNGEIQPLCILKSNLGTARKKKMTILCEKKPYLFQGAKPKFIIKPSCKIRARWK